MRACKRAAESVKLDRSRLASEAGDSVKADLVHCQSQQYFASMMAVVSRAVSLSAIHLGGVAKNAWPRPSMVTTLRNFDSVSRYPEQAQARPSAASAPRGGVADFGYFNFSAL
jgi:hypothetical protein